MSNSNSHHALRLGLIFCLNIMLGLIVTILVFLRLYPNGLIFPISDWLWFAVNLMCWLTIYLTIFDEACSWFIEYIEAHCPEDIHRRLLIPLLLAILGGLFCMRTIQWLLPTYAVSSLGIALGYTGYLLIGYFTIDFGVWLFKRLFPAKSEPKQMTCNRHM